MNSIEYGKLAISMYRFAAAYYNEGISLIPDYVYDNQYRALQEYEAKHPTEIHPLSPTQGVGTSKPSISTYTLTHPRPMLSLKNALTLEELRDTVNSWTKELGLREEDVFQLTSEPKYDGCAGRLAYNGGFIYEASTRGDGYEGEDITLNAVKAKIPYEIALKGNVDVRGEFVIDKEDLVIINSSLPAGASAYSNTRNAVAGILRKKKLDENLAKYIRFYPYEIFCYNENGVDTLADLSRQEKLRLMQTTFPASRVYALEANSETIYRRIEEFRSMVESLDFEVDGIVVKIENSEYCKQLGDRSNSPRWAIAYKFPPEEVESMILNIAWQVGRTGEVAPVAKIAPVVVGGVVVTSPTMHNLDIIAANDWRIGDSVRVYRAGAVVPALGSVILDKRPPSAKPIEAITHCPCCSSELIRVGPSLFCIAGKNCIDQAVFEYDYIFSRKVLDVGDIADKTIRSILEKFKIEKASDFFKLTEEDLASLPGYTLHSGKLLANAFAKVAKRVNLARFIQALCIPDVGSSTSKQLALHFRDFDRFMQASKKELVEVKDVGDITADSILTYFQNEQLRSNALSLKAAFRYIVAPEEPASVIMKEGVTDKVIVITGNFPETRDEMKRKLEVFGAKLRGSVSKSTDYVIAGKEPSVGKLQAAEKNKVKVLDFNGFLNLLK